MVDFFHYDFLLRSLIAAILVGSLASSVGVFLVLRGLSFIGAGIAHAAFAGVTFGFLTGLNPLLMAFLFSLVSTGLIDLVRRYGELKYDAAIGMFFSLTMALAIIFIGLMEGYNAEIMGYLFGNILSITLLDIYAIIAVAMLAFGFIAGLFKELHFITFDEELARASGLPATPIFSVFLLITALTIVVSLKAVGVILVFALIVIPAAAAYQLTHRLGVMMTWAIVFGIASTLSGMLMSYYLDLPSGATIVVINSLIFGAAWCVSPKKKKCHPSAMEADQRERMEGTA
ncbi:MAG TPA: metal ABC transporter permease [bacterium]|nr:metal ABC transporter permease [bacterium]